jgi:hypothetical protein
MARITFEQAAAVRQWCLERLHLCGEAVFRDGDEDFIRDETKKWFHLSSTSQLGKLDSIKNRMLKALGDDEADSFDAEIARYQRKLGDGGRKGTRGTKSTPSVTAKKSPKEKKWGIYDKWLWYPEVIKDKTLTPAAKALLWVMYDLSHFARDEDVVRIPGEGYPTLRDFVELTGLAKSAVVAGLQLLVDLNRCKRFGTHGGYNQRTRYGAVLTLARQLYGDLTATDERKEVSENRSPDEKGLSEIRSPATGGLSENRSTTVRNPVTRPSTTVRNSDTQPPPSTGPLGPGSPAPVECGRAERRAPTPGEAGGKPLDRKVTPAAPQFDQAERFAPFQPEYPDRAEPRRARDPREELKGGGSAPPPPPVAEFLKRFWDEDDLEDIEDEPDRAFSVRGWAKRYDLTEPEVQECIEHVGEDFSQEGFSSVEDGLARLAEWCEVMAESAKVRRRRSYGERWARLQSRERV